jgi:hypothetical protein
MDPQVSTSFIPKEALTAQKERVGGLGIFFIISLLVFIASLVAAGGSFGYGYYLNQQLASDKSSLTAEEGAFDPATIQDLIRMDTRLTQAKILLAKHLAPSGIFDFLSQNTLQNVQFTSFSYVLGDGGKTMIELNGNTDTFSTMALQSDALGKSTVLKDVIFSNITVGAGGRVSFIVQASVDPSLLSYAKQVTAQAQAGSAGALQSTAPSPTGAAQPPTPPAPPTAPAH